MTRETWITISSQGLWHTSFCLRVLFKLEKAIRGVPKRVPAQSAGSGFGLPRANAEPLAAVDNNVSDEKMVSSE